MTTEHLLAGGNASGAVVRVANTVRKTWLPTIERTMTCVESLRQQGIDVPRGLGRDDRGRAVWEYVPAELAINRGTAAA